MDTASFLNSISDEAPDNKEKNKSIGYHGRTFQESNFLKIYDETPKKQTIKSVLKGLKQLQNQKFYLKFQEVSVCETIKPTTDSDNKSDINTNDDSKEEKKSCANDKGLSVGDTAVYCWTLQEPKFYGTLKGILINDNNLNDLKSWMPFIRALNNELNCQNPSKMITYRGSRMSLKDINIFKKGYIYRIPYYVATTKDKNVATNWNGHTYIIEYHIKQGCPNAQLLKLSAFEYEKEVLLPPYSALKVIDKTDKKMIVQVLDNLTAPQSCKANIIKISDKNGLTAFTNTFGQNATACMFGGLGGTGAAGAVSIGAFGSGICVVGMAGAQIAAAGIANLMSNSKDSKDKANKLAQPSKFLD